MSHLHSSFVPVGLGLGRSMAGTAVMAAGAVVAFHGMSDSASWLPSFFGIGDTLAGGVVFAAGLALLLLPARGRNRTRREAPPPTALEPSEPTVDPKGLEALILWDEEVTSRSVDKAPLPPRPEPVWSGRDLPVDTPDR